MGAEIKEKIFEVSLEDEMSESFKNYAKELIENRAIPSIHDGLKPVQRRILYAMLTLGFTSEKEHRKSVATVGEVLGKYHPHGDTAVYEALIRMSQDWVMRYPLVDVHGNNGSIDGDSPAAMRYTEAKHGELINEFTKDLEKECIQWLENFDGRFKEPSVFPTIMPNYLLNGATGIAVGVSCDVPPHNLRELVNAIIAFIENKELTTEELMKYLKGPDFPTGGIMEGKNILDIYKTGRGTIKVRAKYAVEQLKSDKQNLVITEVPYQTNKGKILENLSQLYKDKKLEGVTDIRDESTLEDGIRIVFELKKDIDPNYVLKILFAKTDLETTIKANLRAIVDGKLKLVSLIDYFNEYLKFQKDVLVKKTQYLLKKYKNELHIYTGYIKCLADIDKVIKIIRDSEDSEEARFGLMKEFGIDEVQAEEILNLRLRRLTSLEVIDIEKKIEKLTKEISKLEKIISSDNTIFKEIKSQLQTMNEQYGDERKSKIQDNFDRIEAEKPMINYYISIKEKNIKVFQTKNFKFDGDILVETDNTKSLILVISNGGFLKYSLEDIRSLPDKVPLNIVGAFSTDFKNNDEILTLITKNGLIKRTFVSEYNINRLQSDAIKLVDDDEIIKCIVTEKTSPSFVMVVNTQFNYSNFTVSQIKTQGRLSKGEKVFKSGKDTEVLKVVAEDELSSILIQHGSETTEILKAKIPKTEFGEKKNLKDLVKGKAPIKNIEFK